MPLRLHEAAHHAVGGIERAIATSNHGGNDRVIRSFARFERVRMLRIEAEIMSAVLQRKAKPFWHNTCSKTPVIVVDEGTGIPKFIHYTEIDRVGRIHRCAMF